MVIPEGYTEISSISSIYDEKGKKEKGRFEGCSSLESVQLPSTLKIIGAYAFMGCKLTSITIPNGVTSIGDGAFAGQYDSYNSYSNKRETYKENANRLQNLAIPDSVTRIGNSAFLQCGIQSLKLGNGLKEIENGAFAGNSLTDLTIPDSVTRIGRSRKGAKDSSFGQEEPGAFEGCGIQTLKLGKSVSIIGIAAFQGNKITELNLPASIKEIQGDAFASNNISALTIPNGVTRLGFRSFSGNPLTSLVIPPSLAEYKKGKNDSYERDRDEFGEGSSSYPVAGFINAFNSENLISITLPANVDKSNLVGFDADFLNFYQSQGRKAGTYVKKGRIWTVQ